MRRRLSPSRIVLSAMIALTLSCLAVGPALGLWLPWATEEDKVKKTLDEIWQAMVRDDRKMLSQYLVGVGQENFIKRERDLIERMKIKEIECKARSIQVDRGTRQWAFVDLEKIALLPDGSKFVRRDFSVLQKVNGLWRLVTDPRKKQPGADPDPEEEQKPGKEGQPTKEPGKQTNESPETQPSVNQVPHTTDR